MAAHDIATNGAGLVNTLDLAAAGAAFSPNPIAATAGNAWNLGRGVGESLPAQARDVIGGTINQIARNFGGGEDDREYMRMRAEQKVAGEKMRRRAGG